MPLPLLPERLSGAAPAPSRGMRPEDSLKGRHNNPSLALPPDCPTTCWETLQQSQTFRNRINNKPQTARPPAKVPQQPSLPLKLITLATYKPARIWHAHRKTAPDVEVLAAPQVWCFCVTPTRVSDLFTQQTTPRDLLASPSGGARKSLNEELRFFLAQNEASSGMMFRCEINSKHTGNSTREPAHRHWAPNGGEKG